MHIALSRKEIAQFLKLSIYSVEKAWHNGSLRRTYQVDCRQISTLSHSTIFDVIEYRLHNNGNAVAINREDSAMWVSYLCELSEGDDWEDLSISKRSNRLLNYAFDDGLCLIDDDFAKHVASVVVLWQEYLLKLSLKNDAMDA